MSAERQIFVEGVGLVPESALDAALVVAGVNLDELSEAPVVDETEADSE